MPYRSVDLSRVRTYPIKRRESRVALANLVDPASPAPAFDNPELLEVARRMLAARQSGAPVIWMMGAHVVKRGLSPLIIAMLKDGLITHLASNGALAIHDFEIAMNGQTSEDVATSLEDGSFGMADETGRFMNQAIQSGVQRGQGIGEALGAWMSAKDNFLYREYSLFYQAYQLGIPFTVHVAIGTDIIHQHPLADFAAIGWASGQDFKVFTAAVCELENGCFLNFGSSVIGPEIFLKAVSIARNLGNPLRVFTTANFDLAPLEGDYRRPVDDNQPEYYYRPRKNIINRPVSLGGRGFHVCADHLTSIPNLYQAIRFEIPVEGFPLQDRRVKTAGVNLGVDAAPGMDTQIHSYDDHSKVQSVQGKAAIESTAIESWLSRERLLEILHDIQQVNVGVVGDFYLDAYWYADMTRSELSREAPLFNRPVIKETYTPGGASNVAWNLADLGVAHVAAFTIIGNDWRGAQLKGLLESLGISLRGVTPREERITPLFGKVILTANQLEQEDARLDFIDLHPVSAQAEHEILSAIEHALPELDALVVADYQDDGVLSPRIRERLNQLASAYPETTFIADSRTAFAAYEAMILKPNYLEASRLLMPGREPASVTETDLIQAAQDRCWRTGRSLYITLGAQGCLYIDREQVLKIPTLTVPPPHDPVGAGDTFLSCLAACIAAGVPPHEAGQVASLAAAVTIRKLRVTGTATPCEIIALFDTYIAETR